MRFEAHHVERVRIASNVVQWSCAVLGFDVSDAVVIEDNTFSGSAYRQGTPTGNVRYRLPPPLPPPLPLL